MKKAQLLEHDADISDVYSVDVEDFTPSEEQILFDAFKDESQDDLIGIIKVYRIPNSDQITNLYTAKTRYLFNVPVDQFGYEGLLDFIREKYGSGAYRLIGTMPKQRGTRFNKIVEIEAPMEAKKPVNISDSPPRAESMSTMLSAFAAMMKESQERTAELVKGLVENQVPKDLMEQMGVMMGVMAQMKGFFGGGEKTSLLGELEKYKTISDMFGDSGAETNESDIWVTLAKQFAPAIVEGMTAGQQSPALPAPTINPVSGALAPGAAVVATAPGAEVVEPGPKKEFAEMLNLKNQAAALYTSAVKGVLPEKMADTILTLTPDARLDDLYAFMNSESCVQTFVDAYPPLEPHRGWLAQVQVNILGELVQDDFKESDTSEGEENVSDQSPGAEETLHPGELTGDTVPVVEKELTKTDGQDKIGKSEKVKSKAKRKRKLKAKRTMSRKDRLAFLKTRAKTRAKAKAGKKSAAKSPEKDH